MDILFILGSIFIYMGLWALIGFGWATLIVGVVIMIIGLIFALDLP